MREAAKAILFGFVIGLAAAGAGCTVRGVVTQVAPRIFREVHGLRVRSYEITPVTEDLRVYRAIEIHQMENLLLDQIPEATVKQLNAGIVNRIGSLKQFDRIADVGEAQCLSATPVHQFEPDAKVDRSQPELTVEGFIDDYAPGIPKLRYIEQGNNHAVLTVRVVLKDKQTAKVLGAINITVENTRVTSNVGKMVEKAAKEAARFVDRSTTRCNKLKGTQAYVK